MAATITTQADLVAASFISRAEIELLTNTERQADNWVSVHTRAWTEAKKDLLQRRPPVEEDDLTDTSELDDAVLYKVLHIAYRTSEIETRRTEAKKWERRYLREMREVKLTVSGEETTRQGHTIGFERG